MPSVPPSIASTGSSGKASTSARRTHGGSAITSANRSPSARTSSIGPSRTSTRSARPAARALCRAYSQATGSTSTHTIRRVDPTTASSPICPAPAHSSRTAPAGPPARISAAHSDWAVVHGRGRSTRPSKVIRSGPNPTVSGAWLTVVMARGYPSRAAVTPR